MIEFLQEQKQTFSSMLAQIERNIEFQENRIKLHQTVISETRSRIRFFRETLIQDGRQPSIAAIQKRVFLDALVVEFQGLIDRFTGLLDVYSGLSIQWRDNAIAIKNLPESNFSQNDSKKLTCWLLNFREKLSVFGFRSLKTEKMGISSTSFRPEYDEFELGFDVSTASSASDLIRVIWAYQTGLLSVAREHDTNHIGLILFDEPKQQSANRVSFAELIREACSTKSYGQQFIIFSSEDKDSLKKSLSGISHDLYTVVEFPNKVITKKI